MEDVSPDHLAERCDGHYRTKVIVTKEEAEDIESDTRDRVKCGENDVKVSQRQ